MPRRPRAVPELADRPFRGSVAVAAGLLTANELRGPAWRRLHRDVYVAAGPAVTQLVRARAAAVVLPGAVVSGRSAAWLWGVDVDGPDGARDAEFVEVTVPPGRHREVPEIHVRRQLLDPRRVCSLPVARDVSTVWPEHAALELAANPRRSPVESVVVLDQFVETGLVTLAGLRATGTGWAGRGVRGLRAALDDANGLAGSPPETRLRMGLHATDLPRPVAQYSLVGPTGRRIKRMDLAWPRLRLAVEYDGSTHVATSTRPERAFHLPKDRRVLNEVQEAGWRLLYVTAPDGHDMSNLVTSIGSALRARATELDVPLD